MREGWVETTLGELTTQIRDSVKVEPDQKYTLLGVSGKGKGAFIKEAVTSETSKAKSFYRAIPGQFIYNRLFAGNGSFGIVPDSDLELFVSNEFPLFSADPHKLETDYLRLTFEDPSIWAHVELQCVGSTGSRMRWTEDKFGATTIALPPLAEQRRIVDVIESVDTYIAALEKRAETACTARAALLHDLLSNPGPDWVRTPLNDLLVRSIGGVWGGEPGTVEIDVSVVRSTEFTASGVLNFDTRVSRSITKNQLLSREMRDGDVLVEKSGGGPLQPVGRVVFVNGMIPKNVVCSNFVQLITPNRELAIPEFIFLVMWNWHSVGRTLEYQAQTTGIRNLRTQDYLGQIVDIPPLEEQIRIVELIRSAEVAVSTTEIATANAKSLRAALLSDLLSGNHEIPTSYDELLGAA